jgi:Zn-dependent protease with chaperone function
VEPAGDGLTVTPESGESIGLAPRELTHIESRSEAEVYGRPEAQGWRLGILRPIAPEIAALLPGKVVYGGPIDRLGLPKALLIGAVASAVVLTAGYFAPRFLAPLVPFSWEQRFGNVLVGDLGRKFCAGPEGQKALDTLAARLSPEARRYKVRVVDVPMGNAVALPGGNIVLFKPLLRQAGHPDEVAGVLAHEIAHIEKRHVTEAMIRHYGLSILLSTFGGTTGANIETLASASYSRGAEREADQGSIDALARANISPRPTSRFFGRLAKGERVIGRLAEPLSYLGSHPLSEQRRKQFEASFDPKRRYAPSLSAQEWRALRDICPAPPKR